MRDEYKAKYTAAMQEIDRLKRIAECLISRLTVYENSGTPPSANSLDWKQEKKEKADARKNGEAPARKRSGGVKGHKGTSRKHAPKRKKRHTFGDLRPKCCGECMALYDELIRDIVEIPRVRAFEVRHIIDRLRCLKCGRIVEADSGLPRKGSYGKNLVGAIAEMRSLRIPMAGIVTAIDSIFGYRMATSTVNNVLARVGDALGPAAEAILGDVRASPSLGVDESGMSLDGKRGWVHTIQSGKNIAIIYHRSRGGEVMDTYLDGYGGCVTSDNYSVYKRFDPGGKHQICWVHELRNARHVATRSWAHPDAYRLYEDLTYAYDEAVRLHDGGAPAGSARRRRAMEVMLGGALDRYRGSGDRHLERLVARIERGIPGLFTFLEHPEAEPTNNSSERALRYTVVFRKISGQIKGGPKSMRRMSNLVTCVMTWRAQGKIVAEEVARLI